MEAELQQIDVKDLHFDPLNPRIPTDVEASDDQAVLDWMLQDAGLVELMGSIAVNGFFPAEPLLVMPSEEGPGYWVLEGNRRLAAVKLLIEPSRAPRRKVAVQAASDEAGDLDSLGALPCVVFTERRMVLDYLGFRHITGIKEWEPAAKARYLRDLYRDHLADSGADVYRKIARIIGSRSDYVMRLLGSLVLLEKIAEDAELLDRGVAYEDVSFSLLTLSLNYSAVVEYLQLGDLSQESFEDVNVEALHNLATWLYVKDEETGRTQLGESRNMKLLASAIRKPAGIESLLRGETVEEAVVASLDVGDVVLRSVKQASSRLLSAQALIHRMEDDEGIALVVVELERMQDLLDSMVAGLRRAQRRRASENV